MAEHTPGPWRSEYVRDVPEGYAAAIVAVDDGVVAVVPASWFSTEANAQLIAAAPDLFDACRQLISSVDKFDGTECVNAILSARAAIAKAEGRETA